MVTSNPDNTAYKAGNAQNDLIKNLADKLVETQELVKFFRALKVVRVGTNVVESRACKLVMEQLMKQGGGRLPRT